jgi:hypothetical protein
VGGLPVDVPTEAQEVCSNSLSQMPSFWLPINRSLPLLLAKFTRASLFKKGVDVVKDVLVRADCVHVLERCTLIKHRCILCECLQSITEQPSHDHSCYRVFLEEFCRQHI